MTPTIAITYRAQPVRSCKVCRPRTGSRDAVETAIERSKRRGRWGKRARDGTPAVCDCQTTAGDERLALRGT